MASSNEFSQNIATLHCHVARMALLLRGPVQSSWKRRRGGRESSVSCRENAVGRALDGALRSRSRGLAAGAGPISRTASTAARGARYKSDGLGWRVPMSSCARLDYTPF
jgi:hypothetical protein